MVSKQELSPHALELFRQVKTALPPAIAERLRSNRSFITHGSYRTLFLSERFSAMPRSFGGKEAIGNLSGAPPDRSKGRGGGTGGGKATMLADGWTKGCPKTGAEGG